MKDFQVTYIVRGVEMTSYPKADNAIEAIQTVRDAFPGEIVTIGQVIADVDVPAYAKPLPKIPMVFPRTHYAPNEEMPEPYSTEAGTDWLLAG